MLSGDEDDDDDSHYHYGEDIDSPVNQEPGELKFTIMHIVQTAVPSRGRGGGRGVGGVITLGCDNVELLN